MIDREMMKRELSEIVEQEVYNIDESKEAFKDAENN